jgi:NAD(P)-dependent dehydrogenase (short-subunit alcohol dehydrogenase family)
VMQFIKDGCKRILISDITEERLRETERLAKELDKEVCVENVIGDIRSESVINETVRKAVEKFGRLDYAINCAGIAGSTHLTDAIENEDYAEVMKINAEAMFLCERAQIRAMLNQDPVSGYSA